MSLARSAGLPRPMSDTRLMSWARRALSKPGRAKSLGRTPLRVGFSRSMASMASSTVRPIVGWGAWALRWDQRASRGTQKMLAALYSSGSSGSAPSARAAAAASSACFDSKASLMYLRKMSPSTMCLYSAASMLLRSMSAEAPSLGSRPLVAETCPSVSAAPRAVRAPGTRLVRAPRGLKFHPTLDADGASDRERDDRLQPTAWRPGRGCVFVRNAPIAAGPPIRSAAAGKPPGRSFSDANRLVGVGGADAKSQRVLWDRDLHALRRPSGAALPRNLRRPRGQGQDHRPLSHGGRTQPQGNGSCDRMGRPTQGRTARELGSRQPATASGEDPRAEVE